MSGAWSFDWRRARCRESREVCPESTAADRKYSLGAEHLRVSRSLEKDLLVYQSSIILRYGELDPAATHDPV